MKDNITLYSLPTCGMCRVLKNELSKRNIPFQDIEDINELGKKNILSVPVLEVDGKQMLFPDALNWIRTQGDAR